MLFFTKVGMYTDEEFITAYDCFKATGKPLIYTFFKDASLNTGTANRKGLTSLWEFQDKLKDLGHYKTTYTSTADLLLQFGQQLDKLADEGIIKLKATEPDGQKSTTEIPHYLTPLPFKPELFLGRKEDLQAIHDQLFSNKDNFLLLVNGEGGVGKTTLASKYFETYQSDYNHVAWVLSENNIANALLTALAEPLQLKFENDLPADERLDRLLTAMADLKRPCLLVIDNANEVDDLENNYLNLRRCPNFHLLLTTRITEFSQAKRYPIEGLPEQEANALFRNYYPKHQDSENNLFKAIHGAVGGNTLVIELLAKNLQQLNRLQPRYTLADLLADLQRKGLFALIQAKAVETGYQAKGNIRKETPEAIIGAMYDLGELPEEEVALLSVFAVLPSESIGFATIQTLLEPAENLDETLLSLSQKGWIKFNEADSTFKCSPVIQEITRHKNRQNLLACCATLIVNLLDKLAFQPGIGHLVNSSYEEGALYSRYAESLTGYFDEADFNVSLLCDCIGNYHKTTGNLAKALKYFESFRRLGNEILNSNPDNSVYKNNLAIACERLGTTYSSLGDLRQALGYYQNDYRLSMELYDAFPGNVEFKNGLAVSCQNLGRTYSALGDLQQALGYYNDFHRLEQELYKAFPGNVQFKNNLAVACQCLGITHRDLGNLQQALGYYQEEYRLSKELYDAFPGNVEFKNGLGLLYQQLDWTYEQLEKPDQARECYEKSNELLEQLVEASPQHVEFKKNLDWVLSRLNEI